MLFRALAVRSPLQYWPLLWCMMRAPPWVQRKGMACWLMDWKHGKRGKPTKKIGRIGVAQVGTVDMHGCMEITGDDLCHPANVEKHAIKELQQVQRRDKYKRWFAILHGNACGFRHNQGAVSWVRLKEPKKRGSHSRLMDHHPHAIDLGGVEMHYQCSIRTEWFMH